MNVTVFPIPKQRTEHRPYVALAGLQVIDVCTTGLLLGWYVGTHEANPLARVLTDHGHVGLSILLAFKLTAVGLLWWTQSGTRLIGAVYSVVIANNLIALGLLVAG